MKAKNLIAAVATFAVAASVALPAFADTPAVSSASGSVIMRVNASTTGMHPTAVGASGAVNANLGQPISIDARIQTLEALLARVSSLHMVNTSLQGNLTTSIQAQIDKLKALEASGQTTLTVGTPGTSNGVSGSVSSAGNARGMNVATLALISKAAITTAADHMLTVAGQLANLSAKLEIRINGVTNVDTTSLKATLADMNAKVADAKTQANAALSLVANLNADATDASADASVVASLKSAAADITAGRADVMAAVKDAMTIVAAVHGTGPAVSAAASANVH